MVAFEGFDGSRAVWAMRQVLGELRAYVRTCSTRSPLLLYGGASFRALQPVNSVHA